MKLVLHAETEKLVTAYLKNPPHALLVSGAYGIGASALANYIANQLANFVVTVLPEKDEKIDLEKGSLKVEQIRKLYDQTRTKTTSRMVVIDYAERMSSSAQNAFLKLLEEPPENTRFILVSHEPEKLLPTTLSRLQRLEMRRISNEQTNIMLDALNITDASRRAQLLYLATGLPAELNRLVENDKYFETEANIVRDARELLQGKSYSRLLIAHKYKDNRQASVKLLDVALSILKQSLAKENPQIVAKKLEAILQIQEDIIANGNIRLQIATLAF